MPPAQDGDGGFPPLQRVQIENLACTPPKSLGLELTHWSVRSLQQEVIAQGIRTAIHYVTVAIILRTAELQPHRLKYWKTTVWNDTAIQRAERILWLYEYVYMSLTANEVTIALDEKPNLQVLERAQPGQAMRQGQIERQEFEYIRHGTINLLAGLTLHDGRMWSDYLDRNDSAHFQASVGRLIDTYRDARAINLIMDNGPSHISASTKAFLATLKPPVRVFYTPPHASWLNQAELLLNAFSSRYLERGSWTSRDEMITHLTNSNAEYNKLFAHPFQWSWTTYCFHDWLAAKKSSPISCTT